MINSESLSKKKVLVVEDEPSIALLIQFNLKAVGFEVLCVHDGEAVFPAIKQFRPDMIILDLMLPKMDGIQVCRELRKQNNLVPIIILTALLDTSDKITGLDNGADDYMTKPFSPQELIHGLWDYHFLGDTRIVDVHISHLRDKIERITRKPEHIITVRNVGYKLNLVPPLCITN
ncbi:MAG TPA: response regulator transcription factor [Bacilli bacterium]